MSEHAAVGSERLTFEAKTLLNEFAGSLCCGRPRIINAATTYTWYVFTDAFYEADSDPCSGVGGVLVSPTREILDFFGRSTFRPCALKGPQEPKDYNF